MEKISDIGERGLLERFKALVDEGELPFNDDASAYLLPDNNVIVINIDTFVAKTDAPPSMTSYQIGYKTTTMAISDLAAKGVQPLFTIASGAFPANYETKEALELVKGIRDCSHENSAKYLGGDTNEADDIIISVVAVGIEEKGNIIKRHGGKNGDVIFSTGIFGYTGVGLKAFIENFSIKPEQKEKFHTAVFYPKAKVREGLFLKNFKKISACIDSSDGLAWSLKELIRMDKELGIIIDNLPVDGIVRDFANEHKLSLEELVFHAGEEFELVFTVPNKHVKDLELKAKNEKIEIFRIGRVTNNYSEKIILQNNNEIKEITSKGWEHFKD